MANTTRSIISLILLQFTFSSVVSAVTFYENNYDTGLEPVVTPDLEGASIWSLPLSFRGAYGEKNHFFVTDKASHSGGFSLQYNLAGRNGFCNTCGSKLVDNVNDNVDNRNFFIAQDGSDLSITDNPNSSKQDDGPKAIPGRIVYNTSNGFSKWKITSVVNENAVNDRLNLKLLKTGVDGEDSIDSDDTIAITRICGVDGIVGTKGGSNDIVRRSDCNSPITWFVDVTAQAPGSSIYRRTYYKTEIASPTIHHKLHYFRADRNGPNQAEIVLFISSSKNTHPNQQGLLTGFSRLGGENIYRPDNNTGFEDIIFERGVWYYVEEEFKAATVDVSNPAEVTYNADGAYRLWFAKSGEEPTQGNPTFEITNIPLPPLTGGSGTHISLWGNNQHDTHSHGVFYLDDVIISDSWNGPVPQNTIDTTPPLPPAIAP